MEVWERSRVKAEVRRQEIVVIKKKKQGLFPGFGLGTVSM
jgi:hypothetical protein